MQQGIIVGCDQNQEWLLPWWWHHYSLHNTYPVLFVDFGMSNKALLWCQKRGASLSLQEETSSVLFKKPLALLKSPFFYSLWLDLDCQVRGSLEPLFHSIRLEVDIGLVREDQSVHQIGRNLGYLQENEVNYNSGVILFQKEASILKQWKEIAFEQRFPDDQYALARAISQYRPNLLELPILFNWPNDYGPNDKAVICHFHGPHGKLAILHSLTQTCAAP